MTERQTPDWVVLGAPAPGGGVVVYASKDLTSAELATEVEDDRTYRRRLLVPPRSRTTLTVGLKTYVMVSADTYEEAFRRLFDAWSPDQDQQRPALAGTPFKIDGERGSGEH